MEKPDTDNAVPGCRIPLVLPIRQATAAPGAKAPSYVSSWSDRGSFAADQLAAATASFFPELFSFLWLSGFP